MDANKKDALCMDNEILAERACQRTTYNRLRFRGTDSARVIQVIETVARAGSGTEDDPSYFKHQYWDFDGKLLVETKGGECG